MHLNLRRRVPAAVCAAVAVLGAPDEFRLTTFAKATLVKKAEATAIGPTDAVLLARGFGELSERLAANDSGVYTVEVKQGERIELRLPNAYRTAYQLVNGEQRALPVGSTWNAADGIFYWQPAPGFLGPFQIAFSNGRERINVRVTVE